MLPNDGMIIDNPGMREIRLWSKGDDLNDVFNDIEEVAKHCRFRDCTHKSEPGCAVKNALDKGELDPRRYTHYLKLRKEVEFLSIKQNEMIRSTEKAKWKDIAKHGRAIRKLKTGKDQDSTHFFNLNALNSPFMIRIYFDVVLTTVDDTEMGVEIVGKVGDGSNTFTI